MQWHDCLVFSISMIYPKWIKFGRSHHLHPLSSVITVWWNDSTLLFFIDSSNVIIESEICNGRIQSERLHQWKWTENSLRTWESVMQIVSFVLHVQPCPIIIQLSIYDPYNINICITVWIPNEWPRFSVIKIKPLTQKLHSIF